MVISWKNRQNIKLLSGSIKEGCDGNKEIYDGFKKGVSNNLLYMATHTDSPPWRAKTATTL